MSGEQDAGVESAQHAVTKPKSAPFGSLGGPCGVNYKDCDTTEKLKNKFVSLRKTDIKFSCEGDASKSKDRGVLMRFKVTRLVNDHKEARDEIEVSNRIRGSKLFLEMRRNGSTVVRSEGEYHQTASGVPDIRNKSAEVAYDKGGLETLYAATMDTAMVRRIGEGLGRCQETLARPVVTTCGSPFANFNDACVSCYGHKMLGLFALGWTIGHLPTAGHMGTVIAGGGMVASEGFSEIFDCSKMCARRRCEIDYCKCHGGGAMCKEQFSKCCRENGGEPKEYVQDSPICVHWGF